MFKQTPLNLPTYPLKLKRIEDKVYVFDTLRKKYILLTPEEWVRQHWIHFLSTHKKYPKSLMHTEGGLTLNGLQKRTDLVLYNNKGQKIIICEFKAPHVKINKETFKQISVYNTKHKIPILLVSNGLNHYFCKIDFDRNDYSFLQDLPNYNTETQNI